LRSTQFLEQDDLTVLLAKSEHLEDLDRLPVPTLVRHPQPDRDTRAALDELDRLEAPAVLVMLLPEVDHLRAGPSSRRSSVDASTSDAEPPSVVYEEVAKLAEVAAVERGKRLGESFGALAHLILRCREPCPSRL
jgi:hypothetical protein